MVLRKKCPYFPTFGLNTERQGVPVRIQSECGKIWTRTTAKYEHFLRSMEDEGEYKKFLIMTSEIFDD